MRGRLADTLDYVFAEVGNDLGVTPSEAAAVTARIREARQAPHRFALYYDLVLAIEADKLEEAQALAGALLAASDAGETRVVGIDDRPADEAARYRRLLVPDPDMAQQPPPDRLAAARERIGAAFALLDRGFPEIAAEIRNLLREVVIVEAVEKPGGLRFDGASSYQLWGATMLNVRGQANVTDTAQALAHESGHNLLFGFCAAGSLVDNPDDELFSSPLRADPRPMDGVFHATYVTARMHQTVSRLLQTGVIEGTHVNGALADLQAHQNHFAAGDQVIREGARLTELGAELIESARAYMATADQGVGVTA
jgi:HEXXH motif-containing protein